MIYHLSKQTVILEPAKQSETNFQHKLDYFAKLSLECVGETQSYNFGPLLLHMMSYNSPTFNALSGCFTMLGEIEDNYLNWTTTTQDLKPEEISSTLKLNDNDSRRN